MPRFIRQVDGVLSSDLCSRLIAWFEQASSEHHVGRTGAGVDVEKKRSIDLTMNLYPEWHSLLKRLLGFTDQWIREYLLDPRPAS